MKRKFYLVPQGLYEGMMMMMNSSEADNYPAQILEETMADKKMDSSTKNALLNQRLHGYLKHKKRVSNRAVKVKLDDDHRGALKKDGQLVSLDTEGAAANELAPQNVEAPPAEEQQTAGIKSRLEEIIKKDPAKYGVTADDKIKNKEGKIMKRSSLTKVLLYIETGASAQKPPGTADLLARLKKDEECKELLLQSATSPSNKYVFKPSLWK